MNRIVKLVSMALVAIILTVGVAGCFGNFAATRKVYEFNESFGNKWMNQIMFWVLSFVPVYNVAAFADVVLFNTIEFWTGSNPIAMGPNEEVIKYANQDGKNLRITIRQNEIRVEDVDNPAEELELSYKPLERSWYYHSDSGMVKIATLSDNQADFFAPSGKTYTLNQAK
ncbi:MAG: DUF3332 domain-containing protein [Candidatus Cloacimonetes bacterium]|nr:DUF3332 domain-containing protein [Candidatus Cloacimonadota bacterium]MDY0299604.1 DUF3332 domain-containing protein [Candidatus Cloacimonadaceae bacterium]MCB5279372.1 DUF3332 domain-containing protein [Candidatus Cloacimonadota bacterium]MCK9332029.1 DUF3332 domain-containing protein [Candidatus Cloacimonadota bacterium]MDD2211034.1 DUF3332 domain-containing protein [Candidatus Cloacimonadota bacterium]